MPVQVRRRSWMRNRRFNFHTVRLSSGADSAGRGGVKCKHPACLDGPQDPGLARTAAADPANGRSPNPRASPPCRAAGARPVRPRAEHCGPHQGSLTLDATPRVPSQSSSIPLPAVQSTTCRQLTVVSLTEKYPWPQGTPSLKVKAPPRGQPTVNNQHVGSRTAAALLTGPVVPRSHCGSASRPSPFAYFPTGAFLESTFKRSPPCNSSPQYLFPGILI